MALTTVLRTNVLHCDKPHRQCVCVCVCVCVFGLYMLQPTFIADFDQVQSVLTHATGIGSDVKHQVQIRIAGALEPLTITCASADLSKHLASLVDGYCRLVSGDSKSAVWKRTGVQLKLIIT